MSLFGGGSTKVKTSPWKPAGNAWQDNQGAAARYAYGNPVMDQFNQSAQGAAQNFNPLFGQANDAWSQLIAGGSSQPSQQVASDIAGGGGIPNQTLQGLQQMGTNPYLAQQGQAGLDILNRNYDRNLGQISGDAVASGSLGGSRQGVAQAEALQNNQLASNDFISQLYGGQYQADQNRAMQSALGQGGLQLNASSVADNMLNRQDRTSLAALSQSPQLLGLGAAPMGVYQQQYNQGFAPFNNMSNMINPALSAGGTTTQKQPSGSMLSGVLGLGSLGASLGSMVPGLGAGAGTALGPAGWAGMGLGAAMGLLG